MANPKHILIVDDIETNRHLMKELLGVFDCRLSFAEDGKQAVLSVAEDRPDLILMDIAMPVMDGIAATRELRTRWDSDTLPIIIVTAYQEDDYEREARQAGCNDFLTKPVDMGRLVSVVAEVVNAPTA
ncbi:MAG: response regulator [Pseudomonadales bacterium]|nr:response regulator [Pseudomonadales bacterium]